MSSLFDEADVVFSCTRRQAIEDGVLVQLSGPGYEGDSWVPEMVTELGYRIPGTWVSLNLRAPQNTLGL